MVTNKKIIKKRLEDFEYIPCIVDKKNNICYINECFSCEKSIDNISLSIWKVSLAAFLNLKV